MISCRPQHLPREFSSILFVAVYNELYMAMSKQKNAHPEAVLLVAGDFNAGKLKSV
jgi:hypothetical protein